MLKYLAFGVAAIIGVPAMTGISIVMPKIKYLLISIMIFSTMLGAKVSINFLSMESYRGPARGFEITITDLICAALIFYLIISKPRDIKWFPRTVGTCTFFFIAAVVNVATSDNPIYGYFFIWQLVRAGALYWCMINLIYSEDGSDEIMKAIWLGFILIGFTFLFVALKQKYMDGYYRIHAYFDHSNTIPSFLLMIVCLMMVWGMANKKFSFIQYVLTMFAALGMVFAVFATGSRTGYVVTAGSVVAAVFIVNIRKHKVSSDKFKILLSTFVIVFAGIIGGAMVMDTVIDRFLNAPEESEGAREEFNIAAKMMAADHTFGIGLNQYPHVLTVEQKYREHIVIMKYEEHAGVAHHIYLLTMAEMGYIGLGMFIFLLMRIILPIIFTGLRWKSLNHLMMLGLGVGLMAFLMIGFLEWVFRLTPIIYMFSISSGLGTGLVALDRKKKKGK